MPETCGVSQIKKGEQGTGVGRGTCVKAQRQDSVVYLDNWKKVLMANSYTFFKFTLKDVPFPCEAIPNYARATCILSCSLKPSDIFS